MIPNALTAFRVKASLDEYKGKRFNFSGDVKHNEEHFLDYLIMVHNAGGIISDSPSISDYFICYDEKEMEKLKEHFSDIKELKYLLLKDLEEFLMSLK